MKIRGIWGKTIYVVAGIVVALGIRFAVAAVWPRPITLGDAVLTVLYTFMIFFGTRLFRAPKEMTVRPLWQATGDPLTSYLVGGLWLVKVLDDFFVLTVPLEPVDKFATLTLTLVVDVAIVAYYVQSGVRLRRVAAAQSQSANVGSRDTEAD